MTKNGFLVTWQNLNAIIGAIHNIILDPDKAGDIGRRTEQSVLKNHTMEIY